MVSREGDPAGLKLFPGCRVMSVGIKQPVMADDIGLLHIGSQFSSVTMSRVDGGGDDGRRVAVTYFVYRRVFRWGV